MFTLLPKEFPHRHNTVVLYCIVSCCSVASLKTGFFKIISHREIPHPHHSHQSLDREGRWGITDDFATSFLHFSLFSTALWDLPNSRPVYSLMLSSHLFLCQPCLLPPFAVSCKMVLARPDERETWPYHAVCVSLRWSGGLRMVQLPAGSCRGFPSW